MSAGPYADRRGVRPRTRWSPLLRGRRDECRVLEEQLESIAVGRSAVLVLRGEAGVGKTALLDHLAERASGCRVVRAVGVQGEMELTYAGLHQLCAGMLDRLDALAAPQREALRIALGLRIGGTPEPFAVAVAVLGLLSAVAEKEPLVCLVDDAHWLDRSSAQALTFVARRLRADRIAMVFSVREPADQAELTGLPELFVGGLPDREAQLLLASVIPGRMDARVRDRIVAETRGNPLALLELPRGMTAAEIAGGFGPAGTGSLAGRIEQAFAHRVAALPPDARALVLLAAAEPLGDVTLLWRAAGILGIVAGAAEPAEADGLIEFGVRVRFRHPLVRSAAYRAASPGERQRAHAALAQATDAESDPDRRVWHRAHATAGVDESVASELEESAGRAQARGGLAAAAAFRERAAELTPDPRRRAERALTAAQAVFRAGGPQRALSLLAVAEEGLRDDLPRARAQLLRAQIAAVSSRGRQAPPLLLAAARRLEPLNAELARDTYLDTLSAAMFAGRMAGGTDVATVSRTAKRTPVAGVATRPGTIGDLLLDALVTRFTDGYAAAVPLAQQVLQAFRAADDSTAVELRWLWLATAIAADLWDDDSWQLLAGRYVRQAREAGELSQLPLALNSRIVVELFAGELGSAATLVDEAAAVTEMVGSDIVPYGALWLGAWQGREQPTGRFGDGILAEAAARGEGIGMTITQVTAAMLANASGHYDRALADARRAAESGQELAAPNWGLVELIEAAVRVGEAGLAAETLVRLAELASASGTDWALGTEARCRALLSDGGVAESLYQQAIDRLSRTRVRVELARAELLYGEWLRRESRRIDARRHLGVAHDLFDGFGAGAFAERARRELAATGETARRRAVDALTLLTPQEAQIARLAADGLTNPEIGAQLFISPRTVEYHLRKVFPKLDIGSRKELRNALTRAPGHTTGRHDQGQ